MILASTQRKFERLVHVIPSRYALALQEKNRKRSVRPVNKKKQSFRVIKHSSNGITGAPSGSVAMGMPLPEPKSQHLAARRESYHAGNFVQQYSQNVKQVTPKIKTPRSSIASVLHSTRPAFPTRISMERSSRPINTVDGLIEEICEHSRSADTELVKGHDEGPELHNKLTTTEAQATSQITERGKLEILQSLYYQLCFVEAKADDTFRQQEHCAEAQMMTVWEILQSRLHKLQMIALRLYGQRHLEPAEDQSTNLVEPTAQLAEQLRRALESISQLCASVDIALSRLSSSGITWANPLQLKQHMDTLSLELDNLQEKMEMVHLDDCVSVAVSFEHEMQRLHSKSTEALLQVAHLITKLETERKQDT